MYVKCMYVYFHELKLQAVSGHANKTGMRSLLTVTETLAGTLEGLKKHLTASIGTVELRILGCYEDAYSQTPISTTAQRTAEGTVISSNANNALDRTLPTMSWVRFVIHQITKDYGGLLKVPLGKS